MIETETLQSKIQRETLRDELGKTEWNVFLTFHFRKWFPFDKGNKLLYEWDSRVSREMVGRHYKKKTHRRMSYFGCSGYNDKNQLHTHLLICLPLEWKTEGVGGRFHSLCERSFFRVGGKELDFQTIGDTDRDRRNVVRYTTETRHLGYEDVGLLGCSIITSPNFELGK